MTINTISKPVVNISANADLFIVPNSMMSLEEMDRHWAAHYDHCWEQLNGCSQYEADDALMLEVWITAKPDLHTENLSDHGFKVVMDGKKLNGWAYRATHIPYSIVRDKNEGDTVTFKLPGVLSGDKNQTETIDCVIELTATLRQLDYRYRDFGNFQTLLGMLKRRYDERHANR